MKAKLTDRQRAIYEYIRGHIVDRGSSPTIREIGRRFGIRSTNGVRAHLEALIRKGYIEKQEMISRGIELMENMTEGARRVPVVGSIPAGTPIDAIENIEAELALDRSFLPRGDLFSLRVRGESMKDAGILDGDLVLVQKQETASKGEIVVALINGEATVRKYVPESGRIRLEPENSDFAPIIVDRHSGEFSIAGRVVGLLRRIK